MEQAHSVPLYSAILFDLDGTLTDPLEGIANSILYSLKSCGIGLGEDILRKFVGPPLQKSYMKYCGMDEAEAIQAVERYREYYKVTGIYENRLYPGIKPLLSRLKASKAQLILATSKPEVFAKKVLDHFDLLGYFDHVCGSELNGVRGDKDEVIAYALETAKPDRIKRAVMVGDRNFDVFGAQKNGLDSIGVLYGYGSRQELEDAGATYIAETVEGLEALLLGR